MRGVGSTIKDDRSEKKRKYMKVLLLRNEILVVLPSGKLLSLEHLRISRKLLYVLSGLNLYLDMMLLVYIVL